jgi:hypothetical protein
MNQKNAQRQGRRRTREIIGKVARTKEETRAKEAKENRPGRRGPDGKATNASVPRSG